MVTCLCGLLALLLASACYCCQISACVCVDTVQGGTVALYQNEGCCWRRGIFYQFVVDGEDESGADLYLVGSTKELGEWKISDAVLMSQLEPNLWFSSVFVPLETPIIYNYFWRKVGSSHTSLTSTTHHQLLIPPVIAPSFVNQSKQTLAVMSFNIRYQSAKDSNSQSWQKRKDHVMLCIFSVFQLSLLCFQMC